MSQFTFRLKQDLILPATGNPNKGYLFFPKAHFGLSYQVNPNPRKKILSVTLGVSEISTDEIVWPLTIYNVTQDGFITTSVYSNQAEYDNYIFQKTILQSEYDQLIVELEALLEIQGSIQDHTSQEFIDATESVSAKDTQIRSKSQELADLQEVILEPTIINRYDDVIGYFKGDGSLTEEGIAWAKTVYYNGILLGDLIE